MMMNVPKDIKQVADEQHKRHLDEKENSDAILAQLSEIKEQLKDPRTLKQQVNTHRRFRQRAPYATRKAHEAIEVLESRIGIDQLTRLPDRGAFYRNAPRAYELVKREGLEGAVVAMDLDHFKNVNDTYGHAAGDQVIEALADAMRETFREVDLYARTGGEEFLALLPGAGPEDMETVVSRLDRNFRLAFETRKATWTKGELPDEVTLSVGIATIGGEDEEFEDIVKRADQNLYAAKESGRNGWVVDDGQKNSLRDKE